MSFIPVSLKTIDQSGTRHSIPYPERPSVLGSPQYLNVQKVSSVIMPITSSDPQYTENARDLWKPQLTSAANLLTADRKHGTWCVNHQLCLSENGDLAYEDVSTEINNLKSLLFKESYAEPNRTKAILDSAYMLQFQDPNHPKSYVRMISETMQDTSRPWIPSLVDHRLLNDPGLVANIGEATAKWRGIGDNYLNLTRPSTTDSDREFSLGHIAQSAQELGFALPSLDTGNHGDNTRARKIVKDLGHVAAYMNPDRPGSSDSVLEFIELIHRKGSSPASYFGREIRDHIISVKKPSKSRGSQQQEEGTEKLTNDANPSIGLTLGSDNLNSGQNNMSESKDPYKSEDTEDESSINERHLLQPEEYIL